MTTHNNGGPAFPLTDSCREFGNSNRSDANGMTLRDYFAAKAMQGMLANPNQDYAPLTTRAQEAVVTGAYEMADAMLKARETAC